MKKAITSSVAPPMFCRHYCSLIALVLLFQIVILDSCFSGFRTRSCPLSGSSSTSQSIKRVRGTSDNHSPQTDPLCAPRSVDRRQSFLPAPRYAHAGYKSHMLLAACGVREHAIEVDGRGVFTKALLETLSRTTHPITYRELMHELGKFPR